MLLDLQTGLMIEQAVKHVWGLGRCGGDHLGVERAELIGDVRIESDARLVAVARIDVGQRLAAPAGAEILPIRR